VCPFAGCAAPDTRIQTTISDVRCKAGVATCGAANSADGADYTGEVRGSFALCITDTNNPSPGGLEPGTVRFRERNESECLARAGRGLRRRVRRRRGHARRRPLPASGPLRALTEHRAPCLRPPSRVVSRR
jgi:hypothetical protein